MLHSRPCSIRRSISVILSGFLTLIVLALAVCPSKAVKVGPEFLANTYTAGPQENAEVAVDPAGNAVIVWVSWLQDGDAGGIYGQRYDADGIAQGTEFRVNTTTVGSQITPSVSIDATGDFVVVWTDEGAGSGDVHAQLYQADGTAVGTEFTVNTTTIGYQSLHSEGHAVSMEPDGDFVVVWQGADASGLGAFGQRFSAAGAMVGIEFAVNTSTLNNQHLPAVDVGTGGEFVVVWEHEESGGGTHDIYAQRYDNTGTAVGGELVANTITTYQQLTPKVAVHSDGSFVITWSGDDTNGSDYEVFARRYNTAGTPLAIEFQVNTTTADQQWDPSIAMHPSGDFVIVWADEPFPPGAPGSRLSDIYGQRFLADGTPSGVEFAIKAALDFQMEPDVGIGNDCDAWVVWDGEESPPVAVDVVGQRFRFYDPDTCPLDDENIIAIYENARDQVCDYTAIDTTLLAFYDFDNGLVCDPQGWTAMDLSGRGVFAQLHSGLLVFQGDPCVSDPSCLWGFFDTNTGMIPFLHQGGLYLNNEIWSPKIDCSLGAGDMLFLDFDVYRDLALDDLVFYRWRVRSWVNNTPQPWKDTRGPNYYACGSTPDWIHQRHDMSAFIDEGATHIQVALGVVDLCEPYCGKWGTGVSHTNAPLFDNIAVRRADRSGPQFSAREIDLFQDNFAGDGTLVGTVEADIALDTHPMDSDGIVPGDSAVIAVGAKSAPIDVDSYTGLGPAIYCYVAVSPSGQLGKTGPDLEAPETRVAVGTRYPYVAQVVAASKTWFIYRLDNAVVDGSEVPGLYSLDINDAVLTPGDIVEYFFGAMNASGTTYWSEDQGTVSAINLVADCPMEFTCLPVTGGQGGDILYVDDFDGRGGQLYFDHDFETLTIDDIVDRYDVRGPSSLMGNGPGSRVKNVATQLHGPYRKIIWHSGDLPVGTVGNGLTHPDKSPDFEMLYEFVDTHPNEGGIYFNGDNIAQEWASMVGGFAQSLRDDYMNFSLISGDHYAFGEGISPCIEGIGPCFAGEGLFAYGGCLKINNFDILEQTGSSVEEMENPLTNSIYALSQTTPNSAVSTARVLVETYAYHLMADKVPDAVPARVTHLKSVLEWLENVVPDPVGVEPRHGFTSFLAGNHPNPFNPATTIRYGIRARAHVTLRIYNVAGARVRTLVDGRQIPRADGFTIGWDGTNDQGQSLASGVYFVRFTAGDFAASRKVVLLK